VIQTEHESKKHVDYTQQQSNETHNYEMSVKLHTYEMHTNNFITEHYTVHRGNSDLE